MKTSVLFCQPYRFKSMSWHRAKPKKNTVSDTDTIGGGGGSRTPVRKHIHISFSGRSLMFNFPHTDANRRASEFGSFILHAALKALHGHVHHCVTPYSQAVVL